MPKPLPKGTEWNTGPKMALQRPECAKLLGAIVVEMSLLEASLAIAYADIATWPNVKPEGTLEQYIAIESFEAIASLSQKRAILINALRRRGIDKAVVDDYSGLLHQIQDLYSKRSKSAHGRWVVADTLPNSLIHIRNAARYSEAEVYDLADFEEILDEISTVGSRVQRFFFDVIRPSLAATTS